MISSIGKFSSSITAPTNSFVNSTFNRFQNVYRMNSHQKRIQTPFQDRPFFSVVDQATTAYRQFLGMNRVRLDPGLRLSLPYLHTTKIIDMREGSFPITKLHAYTKDNVPVTISGSLFYKVFDAEKACFGVQDFSSSIRSIGESSVRSIIGNFDYDEIISERNKINVQLNSTIDSSIKNWGVDCTRFEIQEFAPQNSKIAHQLELQMEAERERRQNILVTEANIKTADGKRQSKILESEGELVSQRNITDANKYKIDTETKAIQFQLETLTKSLGKTDLAAKFILERMRLENMNTIADSPNNKIYFVPSTNSPIPTAEAISDIFSSGLKNSLSNTQNSMNSENTDEKTNNSFNR